MSVENVRLFYSLLAEDKQLRERLVKAGEGMKDRPQSTGDVDKSSRAEAYALMEPFAREAGHPFTLEDFESFSNDERDLSEFELDAISGGGSCVCVFMGQGTRESDKYAYQCKCAFVGGGGNPEDKLGCFCVFGGGGGGI